MSLILTAKAKFGFQLVCLGDFRQTKAPENHWVQYHTNRRFLEAFDGNVLHIRYNEKLGRYDKQLYDILCNLEKTGKLKLKH